MGEGDMEGMVVCLGRVPGPSHTGPSRRRGRGLQAYNPRNNSWPPLPHGLLPGGGGGGAGGGGGLVHGNLLRPPQQNANPTVAFPASRRFYQPHTYTQTQTPIHSSSLSLPHERLFCRVEKK